MAAYPSNKERTNYAKLCRAVVDLSTQILRDVLNLVVAPKDVYNDIKKCTDLKSFDVRQRRLINNAGVNGSYNEFDISLLYKLIRTICTQELRDKLSEISLPNEIYTKAQNYPSLQLTANQLQKLQKIKSSYEHFDDTVLMNTLLRNLHPTFSVAIASPTGGWAKKEPESYEINLGDDIERIRVLRNTVYGHIPNTEMDDTKFKQHWRVLEDVTSRMDKKLNTEYRQELTKIEIMCMDYKTERKYTEEVTTLLDQDQELRAELSHLRYRFLKLEEKVEKDLGTLASQIEKNEIKKKHFVNKTDIETIQAKTLQKIESHKMNTKFVCTKAVREGVTLLKKTGIVVYIGDTGDGKTSVAIEVMSQTSATDKKSIVINLHDVKRWDDIVTPGNKYLILLDDPLGKSNLDTDRMHSCENNWSKMLCCIKAGYVKLLITIQRNIYKQCETQLRKCDLFNEGHILDFSDKNIRLDEREKTLILLGYGKGTLQVCDNKWDEDLLTKSLPVNIHSSTIKEIINAECSIGFPLACIHFCNETMFIRLGAAFFRHGRKCLVEEIENLRKSDSLSDVKQYCVLVYILLYGSLSLDGTDKSMIKNMNKIGHAFQLNRVHNFIHMVWCSFCGFITERDIRTSVKELETVYIRRQNTTYFFNHEISSESMVLSLATYNPAILIELGTESLINKFIRTKGYIVNKNENVIQLDMRDYLHLVKRFLQDIANECSFWWFDHPAIDDHSFVSCLGEAMLKVKTYRKLVVESCKEENGIFYEACKRKKFKLVNCLCETVMNDYDLRDSTTARHCVYLAACNGDVGILKCLLEKSIGMGEIENVLRIENIEVLTFLVKHNKVELKQVTKAWDDICRKCTPELIEIVLKRWENIDVQCLVQLLKWKIEEQETLEILFRNRQDWELENALKDSFSLACAENNIGNLKSLVKFNHTYIDQCQIHHSSHDRYLTNVHLAAFFGRYQIMKKLVKLGCSLHAKTDVGLSTLQMSLLGYKHSKNDLLNVSNFAERKCPKIREFCDRLMLSKFGNPVEYDLIIQYILQQEEAYRNELGMILDIKGNTLAHYSVIYDSQTTINMLKDKQPRLLYISNDKGVNPIQMAAYLGRSEIFRILWSLDGNKEYSLKHMEEQGRYKMFSASEYKQYLHIEIGDEYVMFGSEEDFKSIEIVIRGGGN